MWLTKLVVCFTNLLHTYLERLLEKIFSPKIRCSGLSSFVLMFGPFSINIFREHYIRNPAVALLSFFPPII